MTIRMDMKKYKIRIDLLALMLTLLAASLLPASVFAQDEAAAAAVELQEPLPTANNVEVRLISENAGLTVGDPTILTLEVTHPAGYQIFVPELDGAWGEFEVLDQSIRSTVSNADGTETTRQTIEMTLFAPGDYWTPMLALTLSDLQGNLSQALVDPVSFNVTSVLTEQDTEIRDIKPQAILPIPEVWPILVLAVLAALIVVGGGAWWIIHRLRNRPQVDHRTPEERAYDELERIRGLHLPDQDEFKEQYSLVTTCLWTYIEGQYHVPAMDLTTSELKQTLRSTPMSEENTQAFVKLFTDCDLVKFAKVTPSIDVANHLVDQARQLVQVTAAEVAQQAVDENDTTNGANPPSATTTVSATVAGA